MSCRSWAQKVGAPRCDSPFPSLPTPAPRPGAHSGAEDGKYVPGAGWAPNAASDRSHHPVMTSQPFGHSLRGRQGSSGPTFQPHRG